MKHVLLLWSILFVVTSGCDNSTSSGGTTTTSKKGTLRGIVRSAVTSANVSSALLSTAPTTEEVLTAADGSYTLVADSGMYQVTVVKSGFLSYSKTINIRANDTTRLDILLQTTGSNTPPSIPQLTSPAQSAVVENTTGISLKWNCSDSDGDQLTYDIFFGETDQLKLVSANATSTTYSIPLLKNKTSYQWQISARDSKGSMTKSTIGYFSVDSINTGGVNSDGLIAYYPLDGNADDKSGNNLNGSADAITYTSGVDGKANGCAVFDGKGMIEVASSPILNIDSIFTISLWLQPDKYGVNSSTDKFGGRVILTRSSGYFTSSESFVITINGDSALSWGLPLQNNQTSYKTVDPKNVSLGTWSHLCIVRNRVGTLKIYLNGVLSSLHQNSSFPKKSEQKLTFGRWGSDSNSDLKYFGKLDNLRFYNVDFSENEVKNLYTTKQ